MHKVFSVKKLKLRKNIHDQIIKEFFSASFFERENSIHNYEANDSKREQVNFASIVHFTLFYLWSHIGKGAAIAFEAFNLFVASEAEVSDFQVEIVIN